MEIVDFTPDASGALVEDANDVADYLAGGAIVAACPVAAVDVLDPEGHVIGSQAWLTDGEFIWPSQLEYYVRRYQVSPPRRLLERIRQRDYSCPLVDPTSLTAARDALTDIRRVNQPLSSQDFGPSVGNARSSNPFG